MGQPRENLSTSSESGHVQPEYSIWTFEVKNNKYRKITGFKGEDRNPVFASEKDIFYLSEQPGSFNVFKLSLDNPTQPKAITTLSDHPVRSLSYASNGLLC
ncbi:MAG: hypothetical protein ACK55I_16035, partial [bacterium]